VALLAAGAGVLVTATAAVTPLPLLRHLPMTELLGAE
jgi:hypothetical protein